MEVYSGMPYVMQVNAVNMFIVAPSVSIVDSAIDFRFKMDLESIPNI